MNANLFICTCENLNFWVVYLGDSLFLFPISFLQLPNVAGEKKNNFIGTIFFFLFSFRL